MIGRSPAWGRVDLGRFLTAANPGADYALGPEAPHKTLSVFAYNTQVKHEECEKDVAQTEPCGSQRQGADYSRRHDGRVCPNAEPIE
jgi:hypothetical protein